MTVPVLRDRSAYLRFRLGRPNIIRQATHRMIRLSLKVDDAVDAVSRLALRQLPFVLLSDNPTDA